MSRAPIFLLAILLGAFPVADVPVAAEKSRPNIIFLLADDMRWDAAGFAGNKVIQTPNLDALARSGTQFDRAFVTTAICAVSRASIFAGQYARRTEIYDFGTEFSEPAWEQTYPALLKNAGYRVGFIGKFGVGNRAPTNTFEYWAGFNGQGRYFANGSTNHLTRQMGEDALRFLQTADDRPFCLSISFKAPHAQDGDRTREFPPDAADEALYASTTIDATPSVSEEAFRKLPKALQVSEGRNRWEFRFATPEMREKTAKDYYRLITGMDREIGRIRTALREQGLEDNTVLIFTSDNGFFMGEHGLAGKWFMYEESIRVPLLIYDPRESESQPSRRGEFALNIDIAPTILDFAGIPVPERMQGQSLRALMTGKAEGWRMDFFYEHHFPYGGKIPDSEGVRSESWKYVRYTGLEKPVEELFNLANDPFELENLAGKAAVAGQLAQLRARWKELQQQAE